MAAVGIRVGIQHDINTQEAAYFAAQNWAILPQFDLHKAQIFKVEFANCTGSDAYSSCAMG
jgi:hypothetical protein